MTKWIDGGVITAHGVDGGAGLRGITAQAQDAAERASGDLIRTCNPIFTCS